MAQITVILLVILGVYVAIGAIQALIFAPESPQWATRKAVDRVGIVAGWIICGATLLGYATYCRVADFFKRFRNAEKAR